MGGGIMYPFSVSDLSAALVSLVAAFAPCIFIINAAFFAVDTIAGACFGRGLFFQGGRDK